MGKVWDFVVTAVPLGFIAWKFRQHQKATALAEAMKDPEYGSSALQTAGGDLVEAAENAQCKALTRKIENVSAQLRELVAKGTENWTAEDKSEYARLNSALVLAVKQRMQLRCTDG